MDGFVANFTFLRPLWLLALLAVPLLLWWQRRLAGDGESWQRAVDPHLLPHLLQRSDGRRRRGAWWLFGGAAVLAVLALAGPSWRQQVVPLWQVQSPLVIALDLSSAMNAADLAPSRLVQARAKLDALLRQRQGGQVGLLAFAGDAFNVAPITDDGNTVRAMLESLDTDLMPVDGQRADRAIARAVAMLKAAEYTRGEILLVTDHADGAANDAAADARAAGYVVHALGAGTAAGAPLASRRGFVTGANGLVQLARLDAASLAAMATLGGGRYAALSRQPTDLVALGLLDPHGAAKVADDASATPAPTAAGAMPRNSTVQRSDDGYWLVLALLPLALLAFRRGWLAMLPLALTLGMAAMPQPVRAAEDPALAAAVSTEPAPVPVQDSWWDSLWQRDDQRARHALDQGEVATAQALARDPALQGTAAYRGEDFDTAAQAWRAQDDADAHYNRGNALAMSQQYQDAIAAYDEALAREPGMPDAVANRKAVADLLQQQEQEQQQKGGQKDQQQQGDQQQGEQQQGEQQQGEQQQGEQQQGEQQQGEQRPGKENSPTDATAQQQADEAARKAMEQALAQEESKPADENKQQAQAVPMSDEERAEQEQKQAMQQWLRRVPDDPGGLLRRKFALEYQRRQNEEPRR